MTTYKLKHKELITSITFHPTSNIFAFGDASGAISVFLFNLESKSQASQPLISFSLITSFFNGPSLIRSMVFDSDGILYIGSKSGSLSAWEISNKKQLWNQKNAHTCPIEKITFIYPDGLASGDEKGDVKTWKLNPSKDQLSLTHTFSLHRETDGHITGLIAVPLPKPNHTNSTSTKSQKIIPSDLVLLATSGDSTMSIYHLGTGLWEIFTPVPFSTSKNSLVTTGFGSGEDDFGEEPLCLFSWPGHAFPNSQTNPPFPFVVGTTEGSLASLQYSIRKIPNEEDSIMISNSLKFQQIPNVEIDCGVFIPSNTDYTYPIIAVGCSDSRIRLFDPISGKFLRILGSHDPDEDGILDLAVSCDGRFLVSAGHDDFVKIWNLTTYDFEAGPQESTSSSSGTSFHSRDKSLGTTNAFWTSNDSLDSESDSEDSFTEYYATDDFKNPI